MQECIRQAAFLLGKIAPQTNARRFRSIPTRLGPIQLLCGLETLAQRLYFAFQASCFHLQPGELIQRSMAL